MRLNVPWTLRADLLTPTCPLWLTPFYEETGGPKFLLEVILGKVFSKAKCLTQFGWPCGTGIKNAVL